MCIKEFYHKTLNNEMTVGDIHRDDMNRKHLDDFERKMNNLSHIINVFHTKTEESLHLRTMILRHHTCNAFTH